MTQLDPATKFIMDAAPAPDSLYAKQRKIYPKLARGTFRNVKWAVSAGLWSHYPAAPFTDILDVMRDTGFIGVRLTGFPGVLKAYNLTTSQLEREVSKRNPSAPSDDLNVSVRPSGSYLWGWESSAWPYSRSRSDSLLPILAPEKVCSREASLSSMRATCPSMIMRSKSAPAARYFMYQHCPAGCRRSSPGQSASLSTCSTVMPVRTGPRVPNPRHQPGEAPTTPAPPTTAAATRASQVLPRTCLQALGFFAGRFRGIISPTMQRTSSGSALASSEQSLRWCSAC